MFHPFTEAIVLFSVPAVFWHLLLVMYAGRVPRDRMILIGAATLGWTLYAWLAVRTGFDRAVVGGFPGLPIVYLAIMSLAGWVLAPAILGRGVPQQMLIGLQLFRVIGMLFVFEWSRGTLPGIFAHPAGWGDLLAAVTALVVLIRYPTGPVPARAVILVAVVGLLDFASAFFFGFTSSASPLQLFSHDFPNRVIEYPLGFIPIFLVPYAVIAHILSLRQLAMDRQAARTAGTVNSRFPQTT